jgi:hypothetical protein
MLKATVAFLRKHNPRRSTDRRRAAPGAINNR